MKEITEALYKIREEVIEIPNNESEQQKILVRIGEIVVDTLTKINNKIIHEAIRNP